MFPPAKKIKGAPKATKPKPPKQGKQSGWQDIVSQMLQGNVPATGVGSPRAGNGDR